MNEEAVEQRPKRKVLRKLKKTEISHEKAERKVGKLRVQLEQAEATLARRAQRLLLVQARLNPAGDQQEQEASDLQAPAEETVSVMVAAVPLENGDGKAVAHAAPPVARPAAKPSRPRAARRSVPTSGAGKRP